MNIKEAKEQIIYTVQTYLTRNRQGQYAIPLPRQRPLCLMGPPGIGKTAIVVQVAQELGIGLVAYSMTHHTRQSAIGLPVILEKSYGGKACRVSEYTMSEIIASVYDMMEETGRKEGILFLDEINCVSETLAPSMLQFLQYKVFGRHPIPQGWVVVTAGNPPEYNHSARDFDMVTWDRLRRIDVEPDFRVWKEYGRQQGLHPAIMTYLETRWNDFYRVEATVEGKRFVTPRGWADLSESIVLYEQRGLPVDAALVAQYLQDPQTAQTFALYYDLFCKYQSHYQVEKILEGKAPADIRQRAAEAPFDERLALIGLLLDGVFASLREQAARERLPPLLLGQLKEARVRLTAAPGEAPVPLLEALLEERRQELEQGLKASALTGQDATALRDLIPLLEQLLAKAQAGEIQSGKKLLEALLALLEEQRRETRRQAKLVGQHLENLFAFCGEVFQEGQELLVLTTELTVNHDCVQFIGKYGCAPYFKYNKDLLIYERQLEILGRLAELEELEGPEELP